MSKPPIPPLPDLGPEDMPHIQTLSHKQLQAVPHTTGHWVCCVQGCTRSTEVRDYGIWPVIRWRKGWLNPFRTNPYHYFKFVNLFFCGIHWPQLKRAWNGGQPGEMPFKIKTPCQLIVEALDIFPPEVNYLE